MPGDENVSDSALSDLAALAALPDRIKLPLTFDCDSLRAELEHLHDPEWTAHFVPQHYHGEWAALPLRAPAGATHPIQRIAANPGTAAWVATEWLDRSPYFQEVLAAFQCDIEGVRLMRLSPGSSINEHRDERLGAQWGQARLHIPVVTGPGVEFRLNGSRVAMAPGETWYLRLADLHSVANNSAQDRVHLVIDARVNAWLEALLRQGSTPLVEARLDAASYAALLCG